MFFGLTAACQIRILLCLESGAYLAHRHAQNLSHSGIFALPALPAVVTVTAMLALFPIGRGGMGEALWIRRGNRRAPAWRAKQSLICNRISTIRARASLPGVGYPDSQTLCFPRVF